MYDYNLTSELRILGEIYLKPGIHKRKLARDLNLSMPSIDYALKKIMYFLEEKKEGKNLKYFLKYNMNLVPLICQIEYSRLYALPKKATFALFDFLKELKVKPLLAIIFGSYARGDYTKDSDVDIMLVCQKIDRKDIENTAKKISMRHDIDIGPVYLDYDTFKESFYSSNKKFFINLKKEKILIAGIEWWVELKNEET